MKVINSDMIMYHGKPTNALQYTDSSLKKILSMIKGLGVSPPCGNCAYGCRLLWAVDMSTPLLLEVAPEIDTNPTQFLQGEG